MSRSAQKAGSGSMRAENARASRKSKTPVRAQARTIEGQESRFGRSEKSHPGARSSLEKTPSDLRLNKLIEDYRAENDRCSSKINELK